MICYASRTGTKRNLAALRGAGWRILVSRAGVWRTEGFPYALDNGAWSDFQAKRPFDEPVFATFLGELGAGADWCVVPDIVAGGRESLALSLSWLDRVLAQTPRALIAVQDGMTLGDLEGIVGPRVGVFLGGTTEWKLDHMRDWGAFCAARQVHYHVGRVNSARRIHLAIAAGADSIDGSSASRYAVTLPELDRASRQGDFLAPGSGNIR